MGCGVSTFYCMDNVGLVKPQPPEDCGHFDNEKVVGKDVVFRQTMVCDERGETCSLDSNASSGCQAKVACITMHDPNENLETEKTREKCLVNKSIVEGEEKNVNAGPGDVTEDRSVDGDSEGEDEPWWKKGDMDFMRSPSFRDYCIIHYSSDDEDENEDSPGDEKTGNDKKIRGKEKTNSLDLNKKKSRGKVTKRKPNGKKALRKESSGSLRNILNVAACYSQPHSSKSPP